ALNVIHHPQSQSYHVEAKLKLPGRTLAADGKDAYLDLAFQRCVRNLARRVEEYRKRPPDREAAAVAVQRQRLDHDDLVAPQNPDAGPLAAAARAGDYRAFRTALAGYEDWLRLRVGRWVQRYPEAEARVGD